MGKSRSVALLLLITLSVVTGLTQGFEVLHPEYGFEVYVSFEEANIPWIRGIDFDSVGNLYFVTEGRVFRITPDGDVSVFATEGLSSIPQGVIWTGGTVYGDNLYLANADYDNVLRINPDGSTFSFCTFDAEPLGLGIDRVGNYGGKLYVGTRYPGEIYSVSETGEKEFFLAVTEPSDAHVNDFAFDPTGMYGGLMFISIDSKNVDVNGVFSVDLDGVITQFPVGTKIYTIAFDTTDDQQFGGQLYMSMSSYAIRRMAPDGTAEIFIRELENPLRGFTFGPDGMYVFQERDGVTIVWRVRRISLLEQVVENIEEAIAQKAVALEAVESSLAKEQAAYDALGVLEPEGDLTDKDIAKAIKKLEVSIAEQGRVIGDIEDSIARLEDVLMLLGVE